MVHDLTRSDSRMVVEERPKKILELRGIAELSKEYYMLLYEMMEAADGVFLWVQLVLDRLIRGISNIDPVFTLRQQLHLIPKGLKKLYKHIWANIEPTDQCGAARPLLSATHLQPRYGGNYRWAELGSVGLNTIVAAFVYLDPSEHERIFTEE